MMTPRYIIKEDVDFSCGGIKPWVFDTETNVARGPFASEQDALNFINELQEKEDLNTINFWEDFDNYNG